MMKAKAEEARFEDLKMQVIGQEINRIEEAVTNLDLA